MEVDQQLPREGMLRSRRQLWALLVFGLLLLLVMAMFGWRLYRATAAREVATLEGQVEQLTERVARFVEGEVSRDPRRSLALQLTTGSIRPAIEIMLASQRGVALVEVRDASGVAVFSQGNAAAPSALNASQLDFALQGDARPARTFKAPIGDLGSVEVTLDPAESERVVAQVRTLVIGLATAMLAFVVALFGVAGLLVWRNYEASRILVEHAAHTERMAYIGTLAAGLAHEIRSPLNSLNLNMQMLDEEVARVEPEGSGRRLLEITQAEIERLANLVTEFLGYARPRPMELRRIAARDLVDRVVEIVEPTLTARGLEVKVDDQSRGAEVEVDADQMHQMLLNLTENASEATAGLARPAWVEYVLEVDEDEVLIRVHDNGRGMSEEDLVQATEVFYSRRKGGTGLGLAIVDRIARSHGGRLRFQSELQQGTTVTVALPRASR